MNRLARINVVLPVYNPPFEWEKSALASCYFIRETAPLFDWQFHFVNDGSPDPSVFDALGQRCGRFIHLHEYAQNQGKGHAIRHGFQEAGRATFYMHSDWDFPFGEQLLVKAAQELRYNDIILANRGSEYYTHLPRFRQVISYSQRLFNSYVLRLNETDTQAGFKAFNTEGAKVFRETTIKEFLFDTEFVAMSQNLGLKMRSLNVVCQKGLVFKNFSSNVLNRELNHLPKLLKARYVKSYVKKAVFAPDYRFRRV